MENSKDVCGFNFDQSFDFDLFISAFGTSGFQASSLHEAIGIVKMMRGKKTEPMPYISSESPHVPNTNCTIFLSYTSNMVSSGNRDIIRYLVQHSLVDVLVTTAGGVEEDFIKCLAPTLLASFNLDGATLREQQLNRIGNLIVPTRNYQLFEDWVTPLINEMHGKQNEDFTWTPSSIIRFLGEKINNPDSIYYWAYKNNIPVFSPALTDGSLGDMLYFYSIGNPGFKIDILKDLVLINNIAKFSHNTGMIILGGGLIKHHVCNANLMRNGADYSVFINTAAEYDGSDSGAQPDEAVSWGKIKPHSKYVKVFCDATIAFPLLVAATFMKKKI